MSFEAFQLASAGHYERSKQEWERTRIIAFNSVAPHLKGNPTLRSFMPFEWDIDITVEKLTPEDAAEKFKRAAHAHSNLVEVLNGQ